MSAAAKILVVDDSPDNRLILGKSLQKAGYEVLVAEDGFRAVDLAVQHRPDLILLDIMMPDRDGLEVCAILQSKEQTKSIPIVFVTAVTETDRVLNAFAVGGCDYVTKPFKMQEVLARVSVHVRLRLTEEQLRLKNKQMGHLTEELAERNTELAALSRIDPLTKLFNRRTWDETVVHEHERFARHGATYSIVMIDVDSFKAYNDSKGHQAGDDCLVRIAEEIFSSCRQIDTVGRYGGEEFVVLAPHTGADAVVMLGERIRKGIWALALPHPASAVAGRITVSLGVATSESDSWEDILRRADEALYVAKRSGRNMVYSAHGVPPSERPAGAGVTAGHSPGGAIEGNGSRGCVLVVDDEPTNRAVCAGCLERAGYRVREAGDGHEAFASVNREPPDVIILDAMMPRMDGLECARKLKADPATRDIPIIMVSALAGGEDILAGLQAGADEYLAKPIRTTELTIRVRSMARLYRDRRDLQDSYQIRGEQTRILTRLVEYCRDITVTRSLDEVLEHTIEVVADVTHSRRISVMLPDSEDQRLGIVKSIGIDPELAATVRVPIGEAIAGQVFASGRSHVVNTEPEGGFNTAAYDSSFFASVPLISTPLGASGRVVGVLNVTERVGRRPFEPQEQEYIELIAKVAATAIHERYARQARDQASDSIMVALAKLAEHRDSDTGLHLDRVTRYCRIIAEELRHTGNYQDRIDDTYIHNLVRAAPLHDIGKVAIPDQILLHPGRLTDSQMEVMRTHAAIGARTLSSLVERLPTVEFLKMAEDIAHYHHEWYDGSGYPLGLAGDAIPLSSRITALADVYDALTTKRVYKEAVSADRAAAIILEASGTQFDSDIVDAFARHQEEFAELVSTLADENSAAPTPFPELSMVP